MEANEPRTIKEFIDDHERLLAVIGVLTGLAVIWQQLPGTQIAPTVPLWCILATIPIYFEIGRHIEVTKSSWSLILFTNLFTPIPIGTIYYVFVAFRPQWEETMPRLVGAILLLASWALYRSLPMKRYIQRYLQSVRDRQFDKHKLSTEDRQSFEEKYPITSRVDVLYFLLTVLAILVVLLIFGPLSQLLAHLFNTQLKSVYDAALPTPTPTP